MSMVEALIAATPATIAAVASVSSRRTSRHTRVKVEQIDEAVNGAEEGADSIRENVQTLIERGDP